MDANNYTTFAIVIAHALAHVFERVLYYFFIWMSKVSKSSCISSIGKEGAQTVIEMERNMDKAEKEEELISISSENNGKEQSQS